MKKIITLTALCSLFYACNQEKPEYSIISGKLENATDGKFVIKGDSFKREITPNADGTFTDTLILTYNGVYHIARQPIYLQKGKNLILKADAKMLDEITFSGDLAPENNYIAQKRKMSSEFMGSQRELYSLNETEFLQKVNDLKTKQITLLNDVQAFTVDNFKENELKEIDYQRDIYLSNYQKNHRILSKNNEFTVSENFPKPQTTDYDNAEAYYLSPSYRNLVLDYFTTKSFDTYKKEFGDAYNQEGFYKHLLANFSKIKSANIKNGIVPYELAYGISPSNKIVEQLYNEIMANTTDPYLKEEITEKYNTVKALTPGNPSPKFSFENHKGGKTSLDDLKGKFVYIDVWATWCGPCIREIPELKKVEQKYHSKNIEFVSISIDEPKHHQKWHDFVTSEGLVGTQLIADNAWQSDFVKKYAISGIPRFILLDTNGNIISADAPRPSDEELIKTFTELGL
ncbi:TlpA disulfide reductase family protein [Capnocytophaga sp.]|uniref:TlpA family protein disulfide reductase n=1 Tax=Capnocytophaga sp. TaxID=44737 RepID=UPI0026DAC874|nr:TlpA disulfide reductase family protein [Capnocytophaga sp.]MDO5104755.1 TlpA disulfide reductase family protein [Capnocytophaga sp.]